MSVENNGSDGSLTAPPPPIDRNLTNSIRVVLPFLPRGARLRLVLITVFSFLAGIAEATILVLVVNTALLIADKQSGSVQIPLLGTLSDDVSTRIFLGFGACAIRLALSLSSVQMSARMAARTYSGTRKRVHAAFLRSTWKSQAVSGEGQLQDLVSTYVPQESTAVQLLSNGLIAFTSFLSLLLAAVALNPGAAVVVLSAVAVLFFCFRPVNGRVHVHAQKQLDLNRAYVGEVSQGVRLAQAIRAFNVAEVWVRRDDDLADETAEHLLRKTRLRDSLSPLYLTVALVLLLAALGWLNASGASKLGSLGALVLILLRAVNTGQSLQGVYGALIENMPAATHLTAEIERLEAAEQPRGTEPLERITTLGMRNVTFSYVEGQPALSDVTFELNHGESIGIVGPSGGGKSTLVQLLLRLRDPDEGAIVVNGRDATGLTLDDWYRHIAFVAQEPLLTSGTVRENIEFFRTGIAPGAVQRAAEQAHIHHDIMQWPDGYETTAGARGAGLSGGQRQRLCIARALLNEPDILILDEPTSALDVNAEAIVRDTLEELHGKATIILVAHRLSTLRMCDKIMVIDGGRIAAFEPASDLANREGFYRHALEQSGS